MRVISAMRNSRKFSMVSFESLFRSFEADTGRQIHMTNKITVADALLKELERVGVDTIFGIISIHNLPFYDALQRHGGFRVVIGRHEGAVVNMADAYSRVSGKL